MSQSSKTRYRGVCHCGAVRYEIEIDHHEAIDCNCSICTKKGYLHLIVPKESFELLSGEESLSTYTFNTGMAKHHFCSTCGIHSFYVPRSHPDAIDVNVRCLDGEVVDRFEITSFDGRNWEDNVEAIRDDD